MKKLEAALSDPTQFGIAKSIMMQGREAGFDMGSKEGIEAWMRVMQSRPLPASIRLPSPTGGPTKPVDRAAARAKENAQKASRKAREGGR